MSMTSKSEEKLCPLLPYMPTFLHPGFVRHTSSMAPNRHVSWTCLINIQKRWEFIKEKKKAIKKERKQALDQESDQEKKKNFLFFLITFLVEFLFSFFFFLFFFYKFPPQDKTLPCTCGTPAMTGRQ